MQTVKKLHSCLIAYVGATIGRPPTYRSNAFSGTVSCKANGRGRAMLAPTRVFRQSDLYNIRFKNGSSILPFLRYTTKTAHDIVLSWAYGGKKGIRTLEGFRGPTRFPVVRLRPAPPSFHIFSCAAPDCMSYYSNTNFKCQDLFCIFLQKNLRWARCMQNVRANCIFCTFYPLANGGARC